jgi:hypothetical protein
VNLTIDLRSAQEGLRRACPPNCVFPGDARRIGSRTGQREGRAVGAHKREQPDAWAKLRGLREETLNVLGIDGPHIGDRTGAQMREFLRRQRRALFSFSIPVMSSTEACENKRAKG